ncbi:hypothetical protein DY000_02005536 [Brassica cretica]|uniref:Uncharacterized protein n=1 Tax=Brassica cretica TaxID=69181 RepID=A0ABQ7C189_BRACR|nr:hypothetical protein DY000_02005536 [Brassica cretica]
MGEVTSVETVLAYDRDLIQTDPLLDIPRFASAKNCIDSVVTGFDPNIGRSKETALAGSTEPDHEQNSQ